MIFSSKGRAPLITEGIQSRLFGYIGGILRSEGSTLISAGGMSDHVHLLISMNRQTSISEAMRLIKTNSSRWVHDTFPALSGFAWQVGYGAFAVSHSHLNRVESHLARQAAHHRRMTFQEEFVAFLQRHGVVYDERYLWD